MDNEYRAQRIAKLKRLEALGFPPYGGAFDRTGALADIRASFTEKLSVRIAGRLTAIRSMGKSIFADLRDGTDRFQIFVNRSAVSETEFEAFQCLDLGDMIGVDGDTFLTRMGEPTVKVERWTLLSKALLPLPEKWHGLKDTDARYRQRYLDLIANPEVKALFDRRIRAIRAIRAYLDRLGFAEVETPMLQPRAGGAAATPFVTRYEALHTDMYLRIAPELYLKQLLVGGFDKVYELNRCFRNEGIDRTHSPEFTMLEVYEAFTDLRGMKRLIEGLIAHVATTVFGGLQLGEGDSAVDLTPPWREVAYGDLIRERMGADWDELPVAECRARAEAQGLEIAPDWDRVLISLEVYEKLIERTLRRPTFVTRLPARLIPLARACADDPTAVDVFELVIAGQEIAPAYTEINDPLEQRRRLEEQAGGDRGKLDEAFLIALEHGMPPAGGMGVGIDRLVALLSGAPALRDVVLFPQLKPRDPEGRSAV